MADNLHYFNDIPSFEAEYYVSNPEEAWVSATLLEGEKRKRGAKYRADFTLTEEKKKEWLKRQPLTFEIISAGTIYWKARTTSYACPIEYKKNDGEWTTLTPTVAGASITVNSGDTVQFRGNNTKYCPNDMYYNTFSGNTNLRFNVKGNIMSLVSSTDFQDITTLESTYTFAYLFFVCRGIIDTSLLILPATTLTDGCYRYMFSGCTNLATVPELPATTLATRCYDSMFAGCASLTQAPELPATTLIASCYTFMFYYCTGLTQAPELPATALTNSCYQSMFRYCRSLTQAPELPATILAVNCYREMFQYCESLTIPPSSIGNNSTIVPLSACSSMFESCTNLERAPELPAATVSTHSYYGMFYSCGKLNHIECLATNLESYATSRWVYNVASAGTFVKHPMMTSWTIGQSGIPTNWVVQDTPMVWLDYDITSCYESAGTVQVTIYASTNWTATTDNDWISLSTNTGSSGETILIMNVTDTSSPRFGRVAFKSSANEVTLDVIQSNSYATPLTFEIVSGGTIKWKTYSTTYTCPIEYKKNDEEWATLTPTTAGASITVNSGDTVQFRGNNDAYASGSYYYNCFSGSTCKFNVKGNIMSLIKLGHSKALSKEKNFYNLFYGTSLINASGLNLSVTTLTPYCYGYMFARCTSLTTAPELPATTLASSCYTSMFAGCTSLTTAPELPATTLSSSCYSSMFSGCTNLTTAPELPATNLSGASYCYSNMFYGCTGLTQAPALPATTLSGYCYQSMFVRCTSLTQAPELPATALTTYCYQDMFQGCTGLTQAPELPATTLASYCYASMFSGCTRLTTAPELPVTTLADDCYEAMFAGCTRLAQAPELPATALAFRCYTYMFGGCTSLTQAPELPATTLAVNCYRDMFSGCTNLTGVPSNYLPVTNLSNAGGCYYAMFGGCTSLTTAPELPATTLASSCYTSMFYGCTGLTQAPALPATTLASFCYASMLGGCASLTGVPSNYLPVTNLSGANDCYQSMFVRCTSLTTAPELPATTLTDSCYFQMFSGCTSLTTAPELPATTLFSMCYDSMFRGCTSLTGVPSNYLPVTNLSGAPACYRDMFAGCTSLTQAPELPATTLTDRCYTYMFAGCTSLAQAPELPATNLSGAICCYEYMFSGCISLTTAPSSIGSNSTIMPMSACSRMFYGCTSLTTAPELPATNLSGAIGCYANMFYGCTGLTQAPALPATALTNYCYQGMFSGCTSLTQAPELPATTLTSYCYANMFQGCTSLTQAPELPATTLVNYCYYTMFYGCTNLNYIKAMFTTTPGTSYTGYWVQNVASSGTFVKNAAATWTTTGIHGIPTGWTVQTATP